MNKKSFMVDSYAIQSTTDATLIVTYISLF